MPAQVVRRNWVGPWASFVAITGLLILLSWWWMRREVPKPTKASASTMKEVPSAQVPRLKVIEVEAPGVEFEATQEATSLLLPPWHTYKFVHKDELEVELDGESFIRYPDGRITTIGGEDSFCRTPSGEKRYCFGVDTSRVVLVRSKAPTTVKLILWPMKDK